MRPAVTVESADVLHLKPWRNGGFDIGRKKGPILRRVLVNFLDESEPNRETMSQRLARKLKF